MTDHLTLSDVLARGITVEWFEAVAVVRGAVEALAPHGDSPNIPDLHQIQIAASGEVQVRGGARTQEPVRRLGQLLQATLGRSEPPVQLRLLISQATAPIPAYATVRQYDDALGYFERPDRRAILQQLYTRASQASVVAQVEAPSLDAIAPLPAAATQTPPARAKKHGPEPRTTRLAAGVLVLAVICVGAAVYAKRARSGATASVDIVAVALHEFDRAGNGLVNGLSFLSEHVGLGRLVSADAPAGAEASSAKGPVAQPKTSGTTDRASTPARSSAPAADAGASKKRTSRSNGPIKTQATWLPTTAPFPAFDLEVPETTPAIVTRQPAAETVFAPIANAFDRTAVEGPIFSSQSEGISPPVALRPQLPRELPPNVARSDLRQIELIVSRAGTVESVKLVGWPRNVHDSMLLSAVKAWEFVPALHDGASVRYRKIIWVARQ